MILRGGGIAAEEVGVAEIDQPARDEALELSPACKVDCRACMAARVLDAALARGGHTLLQQQSDLLVRRLRVAGKVDRRVHQASGFLVLACAVQHDGALVMDFDHALVATQSLVMARGFGERLLGGRYLLPAGQQHAQAQKSRGKLRAEPRRLPVALDRLDGLLGLLVSASEVYQRGGPIGGRSQSEDALMAVERRCEVARESGLHGFKVQGFVIRDTPPNRASLQNRLAGFVG